MPAASIQKHGPKHGPRFPKRGRRRNCPSGLCASGRLPPSDSGWDRLRCGRRASWAELRARQGGIWLCRKPDPLALCEPLRHIPRGVRIAGTGRRKPYFDGHIPYIAAGHVRDGIYPAKMPFFPERRGICWVGNVNPVRIGDGNWHASAKCDGNGKKKCEKKFHRGPH
jgi:hypothetical protein